MVTKADELSQVKPYPDAQLIHANKITLVICQGTDICHNIECMHSKPHEPVLNGSYPYGDCRDAMICHLCGGITRCQNWEAQ